MPRGVEKAVLAVAGAALFAVGCGFDTRTGAYACELPSDCEDGRTCIDGWCVVPTVFADAGADSGGAGEDATADAAPTEVDASCESAPIDFEPANFGRCDIPAPGDPIDLSAGGDFAIDTDTGELRELPDGSPTALNSIAYSQSIGPEILIVSVGSITIPTGASLTVEGSRPVALVSAGEVVIEGLFWARAEGATAGPGGGLASVCISGTGQDGEAQAAGGSEGGSGGGGGAFGTAGGSGAIVDESGGTPTPGGVVSGIPSIVPLRGGCSGGAGGLAGGGAGGGGGGAIQLVSGASIEVGASGVIAAPGGGGSGVNDSFAGGGGGGSGGALLLESHAITVHGFVTAHGGGGGAGARDDTASDAGADGHTDDTVPAAGGNGSWGGGDGGNGATGGTPAQDGDWGSTRTGRPAGGGGGGGGAGRIHLRAIDAAPTVTGTISPEPA